jgi:hypothetical protein
MCDTDDWRWRRRLRHFFNNDAMRDWAEVRPRKDKRGVDLISDALAFGRLWYLEVSNAIGYAKHRGRSHDAVIRAVDEAGNVIETHDEHIGDFKEP